MCRSRAINRMPGCSLAHTCGLAPPLRERCRPACASAVRDKSWMAGCSEVIDFGIIFRVDRRSLFSESASARSGGVIDFGCPGKAGGQGYGKALVPHCFQMKRSLPELPALLIAGTISPVQRAWNTRIPALRAASRTCAMWCTHWPDSATFLIRDLQPLPLEGPLSGKSRAGDQPGCLSVPRSFDDPNPGRYRPKFNSKSLGTP